MNPGDSPKRSCYRCQHWHEIMRTVAKEGWIEAICTQPKDARDQHYKRGSDYCSHWELKRPKDPTALDDWGFG